VAGVLFALLFGATLILIRVKMPEGVGDSAEWLDSQKDGISTATKLMPFAGITFLWFIGVVRDNLGRYEDRFLRIGAFRQRSAVFGDDVRRDRSRRRAGGYQCGHHRSRGACRGDRVRQDDRGVGRLKPTPSGWRQYS